ncbi:hypothetical protein J1614_002899 [Plenodomus biglobosus]|nr:hypothetical protein J1614_002899 [Plenodomus biglobosus]
MTVFLWTASNFLASTIFADDSYSKPYFVTYINTTFFIIPLIPMFAHHLWVDRHNTSDTPRPLAVRIRELMSRRAGKWSLLYDPTSSSLHTGTSSPTTRTKSRQGSDSSAQVLLSSTASSSAKPLPHSDEDDSEDEATAPLTIYATAKLALEFCTLWFLANYFASACLSHTTVASSTILSSTSSIWTLLLGALLRVERFTLRKFLGVGASLLGVTIISLIDVSGPTDPTSDPMRGTFPHKTPRELATGDIMAFVSAALYGFYTVFMKRRIHSEDRINMPLFFGFVGLSNTLLLWPGLILLHALDVEPFALPPTRRILTIVMVNSASSLVSDFCWAYSMLLTSPLVVTVGLSLTIPLSLVGQMVLESQYAGFWYWVGAAVMVASFLFINREEKREEEGDVGGGWDGERGAHGDGQRAGRRDSERGGFERIATYDVETRGSGDGVDDGVNGDARRISTTSTSHTR